MVKEFKWGKENICGAVDCDKQVNWREFTSYFACETHRNRKWGLCEACQTEKTTHTVYDDIIHGEQNQKRAYQEVREGVELQKGIIQKFLATKNISDSLRQKLNADYQKAQAAEKIIPELEKLTQEYWAKKISLPRDLISEKGGSQTNIYQCNLCENCGNEVDSCQQKLKSDYQIKVLNKLLIFSPETFAQVKKEIGKDEAREIIYDLCFDKKIEGKRIRARWDFVRKLPFWRENSAEQLQHKKTFFQKLKQYFQDNQIKQIFEAGGSNYIIWYENGNIEEKNSSQLSEWGKLRTYFFHTSQKNLSLHEINKVLASLDQEPSPNEKEEKTTLDQDQEKKGNSKEEKKNLLPDLELELVKLFFRKNKIKKIALVNGELVITHNNNIIAEQLTNNYEYQVIKNSLEKVNKNELTSSELGLDSDTNSASPSNPKQNNHQLAIGLFLGAGVTILVGIVVYFVLKRNRNNE